MTSVEVIVRNVRFVAAAGIAAVVALGFSVPASAASAGAPTAVAAADTGRAELVVRGGDGGEAVLVRLTGPDDRVRTVRVVDERVVRSLPVGRYRLTAAPVRGAAGRLSAGSRDQRLRIRTGRTTQVIVRWRDQPPASTPAPVGQPAAAPGTAASAAEAEVLALTNEVRAKGATCGSTPFPPVKPLRMDDRLVAVARAHSQDMAARNYFDHANPNGQGPFDRMSAAGYRFSAAGENIAAGYDTPAAVVAGWLDSPGHCRNLLSGSFTVLGVGLATGGSYGTYWTQSFADPA